MKQLIPRSEIETAITSMQEFHFLSSAKLVISEDLDGEFPFAQQEWPAVDEKIYPRFTASKFSNETQQESNQNHLRELFLKRVSVREFDGSSIERNELGISFKWVFNRDSDGRSYPSAGARYPCEAYIVSVRVKGLEPGIYHYSPNDHEIVSLFNGEKYVTLFLDGLLDDVTGAAAFIILSAVLPRVCIKYSARGYRFACIEAGAIAMSLDLALRQQSIDSVWLGGFDDELLANYLGLNMELELEVPLLVMAVGKPIN